MYTKGLDSDTLALVARSTGANKVVESQPANDAGYLPNKEDLIGGGDTVRMRTNKLIGSRTLDDLRQLSEEIRRVRTQVGADGK